MLTYAFLVVTRNTPTVETLIEFKGPTGNFAFFNHVFVIAKMSKKRAHHRTIVASRTYSKDWTWSDVPGALLGVIFLE